MSVVMRLAVTSTVAGFAGEAAGACAVVDEDVPAGGVVDILAYSLIR